MNRPTKTDSERGGASSGRGAATPGGGPVSPSAASETPLRPLPGRPAFLPWLLLFLAVFAPPTFYYTLTSPVSLDQEILLERFAKSPLVVETSRDYWFATDHPAVSHWINWGILTVSGAQQAPPVRQVFLIRLGNAAALTAAFVCLFLMAHAALGGYAWGFLLAAPLGLPPFLGRMVGGYISTDAYLTFFLAAGGAAWLAFHMREKAPSWTQVSIMGVLAGLAASTKLTGAVLVPAYVLYLLILLKGTKAAYKSIAFAAIALAVFVLVNPVMIERGPSAWPRIVSDIIDHRTRVIRMHEDMFGRPTPWQRLQFALPMWYVLPLAALVVAKARKEAWFLPVCIWSLFLIIPTAAAVRETTWQFERYLAPIRLGLTALILLSAISVSRRLARGEMALADLLKP